MTACNKARPDAHAKIVWVHAHDAETDMRLARMIKADTHEAASRFTFRDHGASRFDGMIDIVKSSSGPDHRKRSAAGPGVDTRRSRRRG